MEDGGFWCDPPHHQFYWPRLRIEVVETVGTDFCKFTIVTRTIHLPINLTVLHVACAPVHSSDEPSNTVMRST